MAGSLHPRGGHNDSTWRSSDLSPRGVASCLRSIDSTWRFSELHVASGEEVTSWKLDSTWRSFVETPSSSRMIKVEERAAGELEH